MASELISKNPNRTLGVLNHFNQNPVGNVDIVQWTDYDSEMTGISEFILSEINKGVIEPPDIIILTPRRKTGYRLRDLLLGLEVPVKSYFRESVIEKPEVQRAFSLMNFLANPSDKISLRYLLGYNSADFRKNQYSRLKQLSNEQNNSIIEDPENGFYNFFVTNEHLEDDFYELDQVYRNVVNEIDMEELELDNENFNEGFKKVMNALLETIALPDSPENIDHARIMSLHSSKGLSAKLVILTSMIDPLIPFLPRTLTPNQIQSNIQEARRLFYVAITRCKSSDNNDGRLVISSFLSIPGVEALKMGISANPRRNLRTMTTRFVTDFGNISPAPKRGNELE